MWIDDLPLSTISALIHVTQSPQLCPSSSSWGIGVSKAPPSSLLVFNTWCQLTVPPRLLRDNLVSRPGVNYNCQNFLLSFLLLLFNQTISVICTRSRPKKRFLTNKAVFFSDVTNCSKCKEIECYRWVFVSLHKVAWEINVSDQLLSIISLICYW